MPAPFLSFSLRRAAAAILLAAAAASQAVAAPAGDPWAPFDVPWFEHLTARDGLPHSTTTSIVQDAHGLVWIGTFAGLVRYDGQRVQVFGETDGIASGLPDGYVRSLLPLADGRLLIGTNAGGVARFDPRTMAFERYPVGPGGVAAPRVYALAPARDGGAWVASERGLDHFDPATSRWRRIALDGEAARMRSFTVLEDRRGRLWLGGDAGLFVRRPGRSTFERVPASAARADAARAVLDDQVWALHEDRAGRLWIGSGRSGVAFAEGGRVHAVPVLATPDVFARRTVRAFLESADGLLWIATDGAGVIRLDRERGAVVPVVHDPAVSGSLGGDITRALMQDRAGSVWVATELGVSRHAVADAGVLTLPASPTRPRALSHGVVHAVYVDRRGRIWLGEGRGRIDVVDLAAGTLRRIVLGGRQAERDVQAFAELPDGTVLAGSTGIAAIDPDTLEVSPSRFPALDRMQILSMAAQDGIVRVGSYEGLFLVDPAHDRIVRRTADAAPPDALASDSVGSITRVPGGWWLGSPHGVSVARDGRPGFTVLHHDPGDPSSLPHDYTTAPVIDPAGRLWVGTFRGLGRLDGSPAAGPFHFTRVPPPDVTTGKINALLADARGRLWTALAHGLAVVDGTSGATTRLARRDGLQIDGYVHRSAAVGPRGEMLFGGLGGLTVVRPDWRPRRPAPAQLAITQLRTGDAAVAIGRLPRPRESIELGAYGRDLRADFALLDDPSPATTRYAYRLEGVDRGWIDVPAGTPPTAVYTRLEAGDYRLRLRAWTDGATARMHEASYPIVARPRWHETTAARVASALAAVAGVLALLQLRTLYLRRRAHRLACMVEARTLELQQANARLDELASTDALTGLLNRRRFLELAEGVRDEALRQGGTFALVLVDLDAFKAVNDTYGHLAGDAVLHEAGQRARAACRTGDFVGRYGGEELMLCLRGADRRHALDVADRLRHALAATAIRHGDDAITITASIGVAVWNAPYEPVEALLARTDRALYRAKRGGRNRSVIDDDGDGDGPPAPVPQSTPA